MTKISQNSAKAFRDGQAFNVSNTKTTAGNERIFTLHDNMIASYADNRLLITSSGWETVTTKARLNAILNAFNLPFSIVQRDYQWYLKNNDTEEMQEWKGVHEFNL